jgi:hypothetical protein
VGVSPAEIGGGQNVQFTTTGAAEETRRGSRA